MADRINVKSGAASSEASNISSAAEYFSGQTLTMQDTVSTITANANCKEAFQASQNCARSLGSALDTDAQNIRKLGDAFEEFDQMMGALNSQSK